MAEVFIFRKSLETVNLKVESTLLKKEEALFRDAFIYYKKVLLKKYLKGYQLKKVLFNNQGTFKHILLIFLIFNL